MPPEEDNLTPQERREAEERRSRDRRIEEDGLSVPQRQDREDADNAPFVPGD